MLILLRGPNSAVIAQKSVDELNLICKFSSSVVAGQFCLGLKRMFLRNHEKRGTPAFILNLALITLAKRERGFVELSKAVLELCEMWSWVLRGAFVP